MRSMDCARFSDEPVTAADINLALRWTAEDSAANRRRQAGPGGVAGSPTATARLPIRIAVSPVTDNIAADPP